MAEPDRDRLLRDPTQGPDPERLHEPASSRRRPRRIRAPLQPDRDTLRVDVRAQRSRSAARPRRPTRTPTQARRLITYEPMTETTKSPAEIGVYSALGPEVI